MTATTPAPGTIGGRLAQALSADIVIDLDTVDVAHLVAEHKALIAENARLRIELRELRGES